MKRPSKINHGIHGLNWLSFLSSPERLRVTVAEAFKTNEHGRRPEAATELCRGAAEILFSRLVELGSWEDFGVFVEQRRNAVYHQQGSECDATGKCVEEKVASEVLQRFEELTKFFPLKRPCS